jgi:hypothetical protein
MRGERKRIVMITFCYEEEICRSGSTAPGRARTADRALKPLFSKL